MTGLPMRKTAKITVALAVTAVCNGALANPIPGAWGETKPIIDLRLRYENVEQVPLIEEATAITARGRLGFETGRAWGTNLLIEGEFVGALKDDYREDPAVAINTTFPVIVDPEIAEINRFQLNNTSIANTVITLGRQRLVIDDWRFVGNVGWRQNEQTFDALRVVNRPAAGNLLIDVTYSNRVNRIFGSDSPQGVYKGDMILANFSYQFPIGKLTVFDYALDFDPITNVAAALNPARISTNTFGLRFAGEKPLSQIKLGYAVNYATQSDHGNNPLVTVANPKAVDNDYFLGEVTATFKQYSLMLGNEVLKGNGTAGFSTPLATLHKFQGWADKWLTTPANGIDDKYAQLTAAYKGVGPLETVTVVLAYHTYDSTRLGIDYGKELNASLATKKGRFNYLLKYGDYSEGPSAASRAAARDTKKLWFDIGYVW
jgi:hypothetical protein